MGTPADRDRGSDRLILFTVAIGALISALDVSIVNIAIPSIARSFDVSTGLASWIIIAYLLVLTGFLLAFGRIGDMVGFKSILAAGFLLFAAGSLCCGLAPGIGTLIAFRVVQAFGAAMLSAAGLAVIGTHLPRAMRGRGLGVVVTCTSLGIALGPAIGGVVTGFVGWRWIFFIGVPLAIAGTILSLRTIPAGAAPGPGGTFDLKGSLFVTGALALLLAALSFGSELGWTSPAILGMFAGSGLLLWAFVVRERRIPDPLLDFSLFQSRAFTLANAATLLVKLVFTGTIFLFPFYFELALGYDTHEAGLLLTVPALATMATGPFAGQLADRIGSRPLCVAGALAGVLAFSLFGFFTATAGIWLVTGALAVRGVAAGLFMPPNRRLILRCSPPGKQGVAAGLMKTIGNSGSAMGVALFETVFAGGIALAGVAGTGAVHEAASPGALAGGFARIFLAAAAVCLLAAALSQFARDPP